MKNILEKLRMYGWKKFGQYTALEIKRISIQELIYHSYSQKGEDIIIDRLLGNKKSGFYVDIGANNPHRFSNTKRFYQKGWHGINIEPDFISYQKFIKDRKEDYNLNLGIGNTREKLDFYRFIPDALSTFSIKEAESYKNQGFNLEKIVKVNVWPLKDVLLKYCKNISIDFISIDTEGFEMEVLRSNDWKKFRPILICIEAVSHNGQVMRREQKRFLEKVQYKEVYTNGLNTIYKTTNA